MQTLADALRTNNTLQRLVLSNTGQLHFYCHMTVTNNIALCIDFESSTYFQNILFIFYLQRCEQHDMKCTWRSLPLHSLLWIARYTWLTGMWTWSYPFLHGSGCTSSGLRQLSDTLVNSLYVCNIHTLVLDNNPIGPDGAQYVAMALTSGQSLITLYVCTSLALNTF